MFILITPTILAFLSMSCGHQHTVTEKYRIDHLGIPSTVEVVKRTVKYSSFEPVHEISISLKEGMVMPAQGKSMPNMISSRMARFMCRLSGARVESSGSDGQQDQVYQCSLKQDEINARLALAKQRFAGMELLERKEEDRWGIY